MTAPREVDDVVELEGERLSAVVVRPRGARAVYVLAHGAGAGMRHPFLESVARALAERRIATFRFQFPYTEHGKKRPDPPKVLEAAASAAVTHAARAFPRLPLFAGGKSMGGRIASQVVARGELPRVRGLIFLGYPLHAAKAPPEAAAARARHLPAIEAPMLFLQGSRDALASLDRLRPVVRRLRARARLHVVDEADHSFAVPKRTGRTQDDVIAELADVVAAWIDRLLG